MKITYLIKDLYAVHGTTYTPELPTGSGWGVGVS